MSNIVSGDDVPMDQMNFAVPSVPVLQRESGKFRVDVTSPGILTGGLTAFADVNKGKDCKLAIDGKKICIWLWENAW